MFHFTRVKERGQNAAIIEVRLLSMVGKIYVGVLVERVRSD